MQLISRAPLATHRTTTRPIAKQCTQSVPSPGKRPSTALGHTNPCSVSETRAPSGHRTHRSKPFPGSRKSKTPNAPILTSNTFTTLSRTSGGGVDCSAWDMKASQLAMLCTVEAQHNQKEIMTLPTAVVSTEFVKPNKLHASLLRL